MAAKRAVIYCRVSSNDLDRDSLGAQERECAKYCKSKGYKIVAVLKESERGQSGADLNAPALQQALELARQGKFDTLVCRDITRYTRSKRKAHITDIAFEDCNVSVEFVWNQFGEDNEYSELLKDMLYFASEQAKKDAVERMRNGRMTRIEAGSVMVHAHPAYGYEVRKENKLFVAYLQPQEAEIVKLIYHLFVAEGLSIRGVTKELNKRKYVTRRGCKWHPGAVHRILTQHAYKGTYIYGNGENRRTIPIEPIVSESLFDKAQAKLAENANEQGRKAKYEYLLARRVKCACGFSMSAKARDKGKRLFYSCNRYQQGEATDECIAYVRAEQTDKIVWDWLEATLRNKDLLQEKIADALDEYEREAEPLRVTLANIQRLVETKQKQIQRLVDRIANDENAPDSIMAHIRLKEQEIVELEAEAEDVSLKLDHLQHMDWLRTRFELYGPDDERWELFWMDDDTEGPLNFEDKRQYIEDFNITVIVSRDDLGTWLSVESDLGSVVSKLSQNVHVMRQKGYVLILRETLALA